MSVLVCMIKLSVSTINAPFSSFCLGSMKYSQHLVVTAITDLYKVWALILLKLKQVVVDVLWQTDMGRTVTQENGRLLCSLSFLNRRHILAKRPFDNHILCGSRILHKLSFNMNFYETRLGIVITGMRAFRKWCTDFFIDIDICWFQL